MIKEFKKVRDWARIIGISSGEPQMQYQRFLQEGIEIHDAMVKGDEHEFKDAIGDTIVTLINLARTKGYAAEECLQQAFEVIELRKGLTRPNGDFVRYAKLSDKEKKLCDEMQGSANKEYFDREKIEDVRFSVDSFLQLTMDFDND